MRGDSEVGQRLGEAVLLRECIVTHERMLQGCQLLGRTRERKCEHLWVWQRCCDVLLHTRVCVSQWKTAHTKSLS